MKYYFRALKNYAVGEGRASRREMIWFYVFHFIFMMVMAFLDGYFGLYSTEIPLDYGFLTLGYLLATACPTICLKIRRFHDIGKSGSWWWAERVPILNFYVFYLLYLKRGDECVNEYGAPISWKKSTKKVAEMKTVEYSAPINTAQIPAAEDGRPRFCRKCGEKLIDGSKFCRKCGTAVIELPQ